MSVVKTIVRLRRCVTALKRVVKKPGLLNSVDIEEINAMIERLTDMEGEMIDTAYAARITKG